MAAHFSNVRSRIAGFFSLPREIRDQIYLEILQPDICWDAETGRCRCGELECSSKHHPLKDLRGCDRIFRLCRQVKNECQPIIDKIPQDLQFRAKKLANGSWAGRLHRDLTTLQGTAGPPVPMRDIEGARALKVGIWFKRFTSLSDFIGILQAAADRLDMLRSLKFIHLHILNDSTACQRHWLRAFGPILYLKPSRVKLTLHYNCWVNAENGTTILNADENKETNAWFARLRQILEDTAGPKAKAKADGGWNNIRRHRYLEV